MSWLADIFSNKSSVFYAFFWVMYHVSLIFWKNCALPFWRPSALFNLILLHEMYCINVFSCIRIEYPIGCLPDSTQYRFEMGRSESLYIKEDYSVTLCFLGFIPDFFWWFGGSKVRWIRFFVCVLSPRPCGQNALDICIGVPCMSLEYTITYERNR